MGLRGEMESGRAVVSDLGTFRPHLALSYRVESGEAKTAVAGTEADAVVSGWAASDASLDGNAFEVDVGEVLAARNLTVGLGALVRRGGDGEFQTDGVTFDAANREDPAVATAIRAETGMWSRQPTVGGEDSPSRRCPHHSQ